MAKRRDGNTPPRWVRRLVADAARPEQPQRVGASQ